MTDSNSLKPAKVPKHFNVLTYSTACPSCGAKVEFASVASVLAVCGYCQTNVVREGEEIHAQGEQGLVLEDYSPIQVGSTGTFNSTEFVVLGRIQLEYDDGIWNEWYIQFFDGNNAWLSEALGQCSITFEHSDPFDSSAPPLLPYDQLQINREVHFSGKHFTITDKRSAKCIAGEGELPFIVGKGWQTWVADARFKKSFITLDYGENGKDAPPVVYEGEAVEITELDMQLLKTVEQVSDDASSAALGDGASDDTAKIECPNCGASLPYIENATTSLLCEYCHAEIELKGKQADVVTLHSTMMTFDSALPLGAKARFTGAELGTLIDFRQLQNPHYDFVIIGMLRVREDEESAWVEYLLHNITLGFIWLVEYEDEWQIAQVLNELPEKSGDKLIYQGKTWHPDNYGYYHSRIESAYGAFPWQVKFRTTKAMMDFHCSEGGANQSITSEQDNTEITYTLAVPIKEETVRLLFSDSFKDIPEGMSYAVSGDNNDSIGEVIPTLIIGLFFIFFIFTSFISFLINLIVGAIAFMLLMKLADGESTSKEMLSKCICYGALIISFVLIGIITAITDDSSSNGSSSGYYSSGGRTGYSSTGSHK